MVHVRECSVSIIKKGFDVRSFSSSFGAFRLQELDELNALIQRASHKKRRVCRRQERNWSLTSREKLVALPVYVQSKYSEGAAVAYMMPHKLKAMKRKAGFDEEMETLCQQCPIRDWFREASVDQLEQIGLNPSTKKEWSIFCEAHAFLSEKYTFAWLHAENNSKGRAVTAVELADRFLGFLHGDGESTSEKGKNVRHLQGHHFEKKAGKRGLKLQSGMRKWCAAFKKRWNVRHGQMMERECMDTKEIQQKVGTVPKHWWHSFCVCVFCFMK